MSHNVHSKIEQFRNDEDGSATVMGLSFFLTAAIIMGLSLDQANAWRNQTQIQIAADAAALAGSANLSDATQARTIALQTARLNLGENASITPDDIQLGHLDPNTLTFVAGPDASGSFEAVQVEASRTTDRSNAVPTFLLKLIGRDEFNVSAQSVAAMQPDIAASGSAGCEDAVFLSTSTVQTGGSNELNGAVCIHGQTGVATGGGDYYSTEVRMSSPELDDIYLASYGPDNLPESAIKVARGMEPVLLPRLNDMHNALWSALWNSNVSEYDGDLLPGFLVDGTPANVVRKNGWWNIQPNELVENTIYVVNGGAQFAGGVDIDNIAIIAKQGIGTGGGHNLSFNNVFFMGTQLNLAGNVSWGNRSDACADDEYGVYLFGTQSLSMGGWGQTAKVSGVVGAAPSFNPGGAMQATGVYFESGSHLDLGGNIEVNGCGTARSSDYELADVQMSVGSSSGGSFLIR